MRRLFRISSGERGARRDVASEIAFHIEMRTQELVALGLSPEAARAEAIRAFGDPATISAEVQRVHRGTVRRRDLRERIGAVAQDFRFAARGLRRTPGFTAVAVVTLSLGIGANTAIFSVIDGTVLRHLPFANEDRLVLIEQPLAQLDIRDVGFSPREVADYQQQATTFASMAEYHSMLFSLYGHGDPLRVQTGVVAAHFFDVLGVRPLLGRAFQTGEDQDGAPPVLMLSYDFWQNQLGGDPSIVGQTFTMNDRVHTVIGVLPPLPRYPDANDVYMPISSCPFRSSPYMKSGYDHRMVGLFGRLKPGVPLDRGRGEIATISKRLHAEHPEAYPAARPLGITTTPLRGELTRAGRPTLLILLGTAALVLLIACTSIANLLLARHVRRERELAVRAALGAGRARILRLLLTESVLLSVASGALGVGVAAGALGVLRQYVGRFSPRAGEIQLDANVLLFTLGISLLTGLVFGAVPALASRRDVFQSLREGVITVGLSRLRTRSALIVAQVAIAFVLLVGAGLMVRSLVKLQRVEAGYDPANVLAATVALNWSKYTSSAMRRDFADQLLDRLRGRSDVVDVALATSFPLNDSTPQSRTTFDIQGRAMDERAPRARADFRAISPSYFHVTGVPLLRGRTFLANDRDTLNPVAVISQAVARRYWSDGDPLGARISFDRGDHWLTVVGVVGDVKEYALGGDPAEQVYVPLAVLPRGNLCVLVRSVGDPLKLAKWVRDAVHGLDPIQPVSDITTLEQTRRNSLASPRLAATLLALFAALALVITATGLAGVVAFSVSQRTQEIGVRMALGADRGRVAGLVLRQGLRLAIAGLAIGALVSFVLTRLMARLLFGVTPTDPLTFTGVGVLLVSVAVLACFAPARRASAVDPANALRAS